MHVTYILSEDIKDINVKFQTRLIKFGFSINLIENNDVGGKFCITKL